VKRPGTGALVASPVLVGAVTVLVVIIAVFISYSANKGLPFVPTYDVKAELPSGAKLVEGNDVRMGGFRVGIVKGIRPATIVTDHGPRSIAVVDLKLDRRVAPLRRDTRVRVRPRSALGLKYVELTAGTGRRSFAAGDTIPVRNASEPLDFEDVYSIFDRDTRPQVQRATTGFGDAFAGRGQSINVAVEALNPFFRSLTPVMRNLAAPDTRLDRFFTELGRASAQAAPVARTQAALFTHMADTFAAISGDPRSLSQTIEKSPPALDASIASLRVQRPFFADLADLSRRLRPAAAELPRSLPAVNGALRVGTPVLPRTVDLNERFEGVFGELDELFENPNTLLALRDLRTALTVTRPAIEYIAPHQTVCNGVVYFIHALGEHQSQVSPDKAGTAQNQGLKFMNTEQPNNYGTTVGSRPVDVPPGQHPRGAKDAKGDDLHRFYDPRGDPAIDAQGNADCQNGQEGYVKGPVAPGQRYGPGTLPDGTPSGGNFAVGGPDYPILSGGTFKSRELGIENLRDVP
jgi:phospholipid/cholesterol/gamma-HCH transport system substrate-binding protein